MQQATPMKIAMLKRMSLRDAWTNEAANFTPWLTENINLVGESIDAQLEVLSQETPIGIFRADIIAKDLLTNGTVLIENQLEKTDHSHLGQLITYASGLQASTIVWIASAFCDEHRAALDWLNEISSNGVRFFGLEIELWSVETAIAAAKFNVVCKPNTWKKRVASEARKQGDYTTIYQLLEQDVTLSSYKIAAVTGVSPATIQRVKKRYLADRGLSENTSEEADV